LPGISGKIKSAQLLSPSNSVKGESLAPRPMPVIFSLPPLTRSPQDGPSPTPEPEDDDPKESL